MSYSQSANPNATNSELDAKKIVNNVQFVELIQQFVELVTDYRDRFGSLYKTDLLDEEKRQGKAQLQEDLRRSYRELKRDWNGYDGYDNWFSQSLNNAQLATVSSYNELVPYFNDLLIQSDNNLDLFFEKVRSVANLDRSDREERLQDYL